MSEAEPRTSEGVAAGSVPASRPGVGSWARFSPPLAVALALALVVAHFPRWVVGVDLDSSWCATLSYARQHHLQFGKDIVFTYGPLGYLLMFRHAGEPLVARMLVGFGLGLALAGGMCALAWRLHAAWRIVLPGILFVSPMVHFLGWDQLMNIGFLCWALLCLYPKSRGSRAWALVLACVTVFLSLAKFVWLVTGGLTIAIVAVDWYLGGRRREAIILAAGSVIGVLALWIAIGQGIANLPAFLWYSAQVSVGYNETMGIWCPRRVRFAGIALASLTVAVAAATALTSVPADGERHRTRRWLRFVWLVVLTFMTWKHGYLRGDHHVSIFLLFSPAAIACMLSVPTSTPWIQRFRRYACGAAVGLSCVALHWAFPQYPTDWQLGAAIGRAKANLQKLLHPSAYVVQMRSELVKQAAANQLPAIRALVGAAPLDQFSYSQGYAVLNGFNFRPRPVFQSYVAANEPLMSLNERFYLSPAAPEYVLMLLGSVDGKYPPLEDALTLRLLLQNYRLAAEEGGLLLLKREQATAPDLTLIGEGETSPGEPIDLTRAGATDIWVQIEVDPTLLGRILQFGYQLPNIELAAWEHESNVPTQRMRANPVMLGAGFVGSPWITSNLELQKYYRGEGVSRPRAISVEVPAQVAHFFPRRLRYRLYSIGR